LGALDLPEDRKLCGIISLTWTCLSVIIDIVLFVETLATTTAIIIIINVEQPLQLRRVITESK